MLEFVAETAGPGFMQATELNPVATSTHATFKDMLPVVLKEQLSMTICVGAMLDDKTSRPTDVPLES
jgi:hypothetical protein